MNLGFNLYIRFLSCLLTATLVALATPPLAAQLPVAGQFDLSTEPLSTAISSLLDEGRMLEADGRWGDALAHYEEALRAHGNDRLLQQRFDLARLHYSLERRLTDRSFRSSVQSLSHQQALDLYAELLLKINAHYFTTPPWSQLVSRGVRAIKIAVSDDHFCRQNAIRPSGQELDQFYREMHQITSRAALGTRHDATGVVAELSRLASYRIDLDQTATLLEFSAAAAGGLDEYSAFLTADQLRDVYSQIEGNFVGLGVELKADDGALLIVHVIPGSPAERAGIRRNDRIVAVDNQATRELSTDEAAALLTGEQGSAVRVTIAREGLAARTLTIRREHVEVPSLEGVDIVDSNFGVAYIRIPTFQKTTARDLEAALWDLHRKGMRSLVLDLRGNPGGLLSSSVQIADKFIASGPIVSTRGRSREETFDYRAHRAGTWRVPLVVLIDGDSASASEIFAAAIKDARRGTIVGTRSFGKGSVQGIFPLGFAGAGIRLTTAKFYSPLGHPISKLGVDPHIGPRRATSVTERTSEAREVSHSVAYRGLEPAASEQPQDEELARAVEVARNQPAAVL